MLILSRLPEQEIVVSGPSRIKVLSIGRGKVKLGVTADVRVRVDRGEIDESRPPHERCPVPKEPS